MKRRTLFSASAAACSLAIVCSATSAFAQSSTASQQQEVLVTTSRGPHSMSGLMVAETAPKARSALDSQYIMAQAPGQTILDTINLLPGVNFTNNDAFGSAGGDITLRGFDSQRLALLQDGVP